MRIAYLLTWSGDDRTGVFKKVTDQVATWERFGVEAAIFIATTPSAQTAWSQVRHVQHIEVYRNGIASGWSQLPLLRALKGWRPDIAYVRTSPRHFVISRQLRGIPHAIEIQTDDISESRGISLARLATTLATRRACLMWARGMVFTSQELSERASYQGFTASRTVIANGIDLSRIEPLPPVQNRGQGLRFAFMGLPGSSWHGIDQVVALARKRPEWSFDAIGPSAADMSWPANVRAHGELTADEYRPILSQADAAISTLAWFRNGMNEGSPLKSREYFALGIPVIGAYLDTDLPAGAEFYLRLPNQEGALVDHVDSVERFAQNWHGRRIDRSAIQMLDQETKEQKRIQFLRALVEPAPLN